MAQITHSEVLIADLPTESVTITPRQATVVRQVNTTIQPGQNEITILGLDPKIDVDSIRVSGSGQAATITDTQTRFVPRRQNFEDKYPEESEADDDGDGADSEYDDGIDNTQLRSVREQITQVKATLAQAWNDKDMAISVLGFLNHYGAMLHTEHTDVGKLNEFLQLYIQHRTNESERHCKATAETIEAEKHLEQLNSKEKKLEQGYQKAKEKASKQVRKKHQKLRWEREQKRNERNRQRLEQQQFWTMTVGQVKLCLDSNSAAVTPTPSQRSSDVEKADKAEDNTEMTLHLSYVVPGPNWTAIYELSIDTPSSSARLVYRAGFQNISSETWKDVHVTLSTSQASFPSLEDRIPSLQAWYIDLETNKNNNLPSWEKILRSPDDISQPSNEFQKLFNREKERSKLGKQNQQPQPATHGISPSPLGPFEKSAYHPVQSSGLFGSVPQPASTLSPFGQPAQSQSASSNLSGQPAPQSTNQAQPPSAPSKSSFSSTQSGGLFGSTYSNQTPFPMPQRPLFGSAASSNSKGFAAPQGPSYKPSESAALFGGIFGAKPQAAKDPSPSTGPTQANSNSNSPDDDGDGGDDDDISNKSASFPNVKQQDSVKEDYGVTTTYNLPGRRTLVPSNIHHRHVLAELNLKTMTLTHTIVPRIREAAFLRARIQNTSSVNILRGRTGMSVDGTFLGTSSIPNCAPDAFFNISLGIDPSILVKYGKPTVRRVPAGIFNSKDNAAVFRRTTWVKNTKPIPVDIMVADQVPLNEDEKVRMQVLEPKEVEKEGGEVKITMEDGQGKGVATMAKNGEIKWSIRLEPGKDIQTVLEYEVKVPVGSDFKMG